MPKLYIYFRYASINERSPKNFQSIIENKILKSSLNRDCEGKILEIIN